MDTNFSVLCPLFPLSAILMKKSAIRLVRTIIHKNQEFIITRMYHKHDKHDEQINCSQNMSDNSYLHGCYLIAQYEIII